MDNIAFKFRIYPNKQQRCLILKTFGCVRFVYNHYLQERIDYYHSWHQSLSYNKNATDLTQLKKTLEWLREVDSIALQQSLKHLNTAYDNFFNKYSEFPRFKSKHYSKKSYHTINQKGSIQIVGHYIKLPKLGCVKIRQHKAIPDEYTLKSVTVSQAPSGKYFVSVLFEYENQVEKQNNRDKAIGLDFSMSELYVDSFGNEANMPHYYRLTEKRLAKAQRKLSKMHKKGLKQQSNRYHKQKHRVAILHEKVANQRKDFLHKLSAHLVREYDYICIEDLNMKGMSQSLNFGKSVHDNGWGMFTTMLTYKAERKGKHVVRIDKFFPSSQTCSVCGSINPLTKDLNIREWTCPDCYTVHNRDTNAAINILNEGMRLAA